MASESLKGRLWAKIVAAKIRNQAAVLEAADSPQVRRLLSLADRIKGAMREIWRRVQPGPTSRACLVGDSRGVMRETG